MQTRDDYPSTLVTYDLYVKIHTIFFLQGTHISYILSVDVKIPTRYFFRWKMLRETIHVNITWLWRSRGLSNISVYHIHMAPRNHRESCIVIKRTPWIGHQQDTWIGTNNLGTIKKTNNLRLFEFGMQQNILMHDFNVDGNEKEC